MIRPGPEILRGGSMEEGDPGKVQPSSFESRSNGRGPVSMGLENLRVILLHHPLRSLDHGLTRIRTHKLIITGNDHTRERSSISGDFVHTNFMGDIDPAMANIKSDFDGHGPQSFI